jgi:hypothetical protein
VFASTVLIQISNAIRIEPHRRSSDDVVDIDVLIAHSVDGRVAIGARGDGTVTAMDESTLNKPKDNAR